MATRTQARELVVELLYAYAMGNERIFDFADDLLSAKKIRNAQADFAKGLFKGILAHLQKIDSIIEANLKSWEISRLGVIDKCILRLGAYEILKGEIDAPVAINEAIEIAKILGAENTGRFVNGVLDAIRKGGFDLEKGVESHKNSSLGAPLALGENFGEQQTTSLVLSPKFSPNTKLPPQNTRIDNLDSANQTQNAESNKNSPSLAEGARGWVKTPSLRDYVKQNRGNPPIEKNIDSQSGLPRSPTLARNDEFLDSADSQNLVKNNPCEAPENSPASWCKKSDSRLQKCNRRFFARSGESEALPLKAKSGSFWRVGGAGRGVQPFCEKESSESKKPKNDRFAKSTKKSTKSQNSHKNSKSGLLRAKRTRNDNIKNQKSTQKRNTK